MTSKMTSKTLDVRTLEPAWVNPARAAIAADLARFAARYPRCEIRDGRLRLKPDTGATPRAKGAKRCE